MDNRLKDFLRTFQELIERDSGMPWTLQAIKEDMHLILFDGTITLEGEHAVRIDEHKIRGIVWSYHLIRLNK
ncbi:hypothetical protein QA542_00615 [Staphylococcus saprophyticus]|nr:hypothetical protein QA542_00615 [Staphylococcus saprophyticus]